MKVVDTELPQAFDLLTDLVANPRLAKDDLEREQKVIIEEMKRIEDTPDEVLTELFNAAYSPDHSLGRPIEGTEETVSSFDRETTARFHSQHYAPRNLVIAAAGNIAHHELTAMAVKAFGDGGGQTEHGTSVSSAPVTAAPILIERKWHL